MTAVFLGAAYWSSAVLEVAGARSRTLGPRPPRGVDRARCSPTLTLVVTLVHLDKFHLGAEHPASARAVTWGWLAIYAVVPVAMVVGLVLQARAGGTRVVDVVPPPGGRCGGCSSASPSCCSATGVALLLAPEWAADAWAWPLTAAHRPRHRRVAGRARLGLGPRPTRRRPAVDAARRAHRGGVRRAPGGGTAPVRRRARLVGPGRRRRTSRGWRASAWSRPGSWRPGVRRLPVA